MKHGKFNEGLYNVHLNVLFLMLNMLWNCWCVCCYTVGECGQDKA